jgi:hypothetical protein
VRLVVALVALAIIAIVLRDAFETVVLPRTVSRRFRLTRLYFRSTWLVWRSWACGVQSAGRRERLLAVFGPLSLLGLLTVWATALIIAFGALQWSIGTGSSGEALYISGTLFFTLGFDQLHPAARLARLLAVVEGGMGFGFLAIVISYFPVFYQSFSRREVRLTLLDAWAGSPPAAAEVLRRLSRTGELASLQPFLRDWEVWCSELLENGISYPAVAYFRSQHQRQSWVSALTTMLDLTSLAIVGLDGVPQWQAHATFAIARHAAVDLTQVFRATPDFAISRLDDNALAQLRHHLEEVGLQPRRSADADAELRRLRESYEPYVAGLSQLFLMPLPEWFREKPARDNWETSPKRAADQHL